MGDTVFYTKAFMQKLKKELDHLVQIERPKISQQIAEARDKGDLSENAEYDAAKESQGLLELKIGKLKDLIFNARIIDESKMDASKVLLLSHVTIENIANKKQMAYSIVPEKEADMKSGKISVTSPIAKGLLGKTIGDEVEITVPAGKITFKIINISR
jgi:transcription elongation factor GreA